MKGKKEKIKALKVAFNYWIRLTAKMKFWPIYNSLMTNNWNKAYENESVQNRMSELALDKISEKKQVFTNTNAKYRWRVIPIKGFIQNLKKVLPAIKM
jgi:hypothetical protein